MWTGPTDFESAGPFILQALWGQHNTHPFPMSLCPHTKLLHCSSKQWCCTHQTGDYWPPGGSLCESFVTCVCLPWAALNPPLQKPEQRPQPIKHTGSRHTLALNTSLTAAALQQPFFGLSKIKRDVPASLLLIKQKYSIKLPLIIKLSLHVICHLCRICTCNHYWRKEMSTSKLLTPTSWKFCLSRWWL